MRCSSHLPVQNDDAQLLADDDTPCSGRGDCLNGTCLCEIRYSGDECSGFNLPYHAGKIDLMVFDLFIIFLIIYILFILH